MKYACILWSEPFVLAFCSIWLYIVFLVSALGICVRVSLRKLECRSASLVILGGVSLFIFWSWGHVPSPPTGGFASVNIMSFDYVAGGCVCFIVVYDSRVRFHLAYVCLVSHVVSCVYDGIR